MWAARRVCGYRLGSNRLAINLQKVIDKKLAKGYPKNSKV